ncbi:MAG: DoxX family protein [Paracoccaceae bacterium]
MNALSRIHKNVFDTVSRADWILPTLARFLFGAVLASYFWVSALTKVEDGLSGLWTLKFGAYAQIFPKVMETVSFDISALSAWQHGVVYLATYAEFVLPAFIIMGFLTRVSAIGMIVFIIVMSLTDLFGHATLSDPKVFGAWFDKAPDSLILDQRALWVFLLLVLIVKGAGPISLDNALAPRKNPHSD